jgi:Ala-tRNA(Pro) deacylase
MSASASIQEFLNKAHIPYSTVTHPPAFTAQEEAAVTHVPGRDWAKTIVCYADAEPVLVVLPATLSIDFDKLKDLAGANTLRLATEQEIAGLYPDCEVGAMPPFGPLYHQRVFVDERLTQDHDILFNAGTHTDAIRMRYADFAAAVQPITGNFGE